MIGFAYQHQAAAQSGQRFRLRISFFLVIHPKIA
jgi:hypothetical protein